jgi:hypothetical protein
VPVTRMNYSLNHNRNLSRSEYYDPEKRPARLRSVPPPRKWFKAKYAGRCVNCDEEFPVGTKIRRRKDGKYVHSGGCPTKMMTPRQKAERAAYQRGNRFWDEQAAKGR